MAGAVVRVAARPGAEIPDAAEQFAGIRDAISQALDAGFSHITLSLPAPYPANVARWVADELIAKSRTA